jgi:hypothetical protein
MIPPRGALLSLVALALACKQAPRVSGSVVSEQAVWLQDSTCDFERHQAHSDAAELAVGFVARDAAGDFLQSDPWFDGATTCPGHEPGPDMHSVVAGYRMDLELQTDTLVEYRVSYANLGMIHYEQRPGDPDYHAVWTPQIGEFAETLTVVRTTYGWRVRSPALWQHVLADTVLRREAGRLQPTDSQRMRRLVDSLRGHGWGGGA